MMKSRKFLGKNQSVCSPSCSEVEAAAAKK
jgi:hypothetical protein